jgi:hypothetical protein
MITNLKSYLLYNGESIFHAAVLIPSLSRFVRSKTHDPFASLFNKNCATHLLHAQDHKARKTRLEVGMKMVITFDFIFLFKNRIEKAS